MAPKIYYAIKFPCMHPALLRLALSLSLSSDSFFLSGLSILLTKWLHTKATSAGGKVPSVGNLEFHF